VRHGIGIESSSGLAFCTGKKSENVFALKQFVALSRSGRRCDTIPAKVGPYRASGQAPNTSVGVWHNLPQQCRLEETLVAVLM